MRYAISVSATFQQESSSMCALMLSRGNVRQKIDASTSVEQKSRDSSRGSSQEVWNLLLLTMMDLLLAARGLMENFKMSNHSLHAARAPVRRGASCSALV
jgi:hypothetical protein